MTLTIASHNIAAKAKAWQRATFAHRLPSIRSGVAYYEPAILLVQEAGSTSYLRKLDAELKRSHLVRAPHGGRWRYIYYDPRKVRLIASGLLTLNLLKTKHAAWARFEELETGRHIFTSSVHLSQGNESKAQARYRQAETLLRKSKPHLYGAPEVHGGDFNSWSNVGRVVFQPLHYADALEVATHRVNPSFDTYNGRNTVKANPRTQKRGGRHDDHLYVSRSLAGRVIRWQQRPTVAASDHNLISIQVKL